MLLDAVGPSSDSNVSIASGSDVTICISSGTLMKQETINESKLVSPEALTRQLLLHPEA